jgi:ribosomal protein S18 acetylase RimI-like enzyme
MQTLTPISYFKRYRMEVQLDRLPAPVLPPGYRVEPWRFDLLEAHAEVLFRCFETEIDSQVFPSLGNREGCAALLAEIARRKAFVPEATFLLVGPDGPCGTIQGMRERGVLGSVQNIGIVPPSRGQGLGRGLLLCGLHGFRATGLGRALLEVTARNAAAVRLYERLGFRRVKTLYKAVAALPTL